jgi:hypothetical protein
MPGVKVQVNRRCPESDIRARGSSCGTQTTLSSLWSTAAQDYSFSLTRGQKRARSCHHQLCLKVKTLRAHQPVPGVSLSLFHLSDDAKNKITLARTLKLMDSLREYLFFLVAIRLRKPEAINVWYPMKTHFFQSN